MKRKTFLLPSVLHVFFLLKTLFFLSFSLQNIFLLILEILFVSFTDENLFFSLIDKKKIRFFTQFHTWISLLANRIFHFFLRLVSQMDK